MTNWSRDVFAEMTQRDYGYDPAAGPDKTIVAEWTDEQLVLVREIINRQQEPPKRCMCWRCRAIGLQALIPQPAHNKCANCADPCPDNKIFCAECQRCVDAYRKASGGYFDFSDHVDNLAAAIDAIHAARREGSLRYWPKD